MIAINIFLLSNSISNLKYFYNFKCFGEVYRRTRERSSSGYVGGSSDLRFSNFQRTPTGRQQSRPTRQQHDPHGLSAGRMAGGTLDDGPRVTLQLPGGDVVIGIGVGIGPDGMGAAMTGFTGPPAVALAVAKQGAGFFGEGKMGDTGFFCFRHRTRYFTDSVNLGLK